MTVFIGKPVTRTINSNVSARVNAYKVYDWLTDFRSQLIICRAL